MRQLPDALLRLPPDMQRAILVEVDKQLASRDRQHLAEVASLKKRIAELRGEDHVPSS